MSSSAKHGLEGIEDVGGRVMYCAQYRPYGEPLSGAGFVERYANGKLDLHIHAALTRNDAEARQLCAVVHRAEPRPANKLESVRRVAQQPNTQPREVDRPVLVYVPELVEQPEGVEVWLPIASRERLRPLDQCSLCFVEPTDPPIPGRLGRGFNEYGIGAVSEIRFGSEIADGELASEIVESRTYVLERITDEQGPVERSLALNAAFADELAGARIELLDDSVRVLLSHELVHGEIQRIHVRTGPSEFGFRSVERMSHDLESCHD